MSTRKGGQRSRKPAHQNATAFKHNPKSKKTAYILGIKEHGLCQRCYDIIEWKKKYRKYKPLKAPKKCTDCGQSRVTRAYHVICDKCQDKRGVCAKCLQSAEIVEEDTERERLMDELEILLADGSGMKERERRARIREITKLLKPPKDEDGTADEEGSDDDGEAEEDGEGGGDDGSSAAAEEEEGDEEGDEEGEEEGTAPDAPGA
jgi:hypothetical protein